MVKNLSEEGRDFIKLQKYCRSVTTMPKPNSLDDLLVVRNTPTEVDPSSVNGETELNAYMRVQQVSNDADPLTWRK